MKMRIYRNDLELLKWPQMTFELNHSGGITGLHFTMSSCHEFLGDSWNRGHVPNLKVQIICCLSAIKLKSFKMILSAIFVILCLCDICCYVDKKQIRRLGRLVEPSGLINNHTERPLRARNQSKMSHFVATVWFTSVNKVRVCIIISLFLFTKGTLYSHSGFKKFEKEKSEITMKFSLFKIMIFGKFLGELFNPTLSFFSGFQIGAPTYNSHWFNATGQSDSLRSLTNEKRF